MKICLVQGAGAIAILAMLICAQPPVHAQGPPGAPSEKSALSIPEAQLIQPEELNRLLLAGGEKPLVLQVGSHVLFAQAHIAGSEYAGPGSESDGLKKLRKRVETLSRQTLIVLYCGCCPWNHCPNVGPAFKLLHDMGFAHVKALYVANNLGTDWVDKGYPVERGH